MPVTLINSFVVPASQSDAFLETWTKTARAIEKAPGFISATLHRALHADAKFSFVNVALWESEELYRAAFAQSPVPRGGVQPEAYPALYDVAVHVKAP
jgi:heme-degrading monooxygenase HmoA